MKCWIRKGTNGNQRVFDIFYIQGNRSNMIKMVNSLAIEAKTAGASSIRINGHVIANPKLNHFLNNTASKGTLGNWKIQKGDNTFSLSQDF